MLKPHRLNNERNLRIYAQLSSSSPPMKGTGARASIQQTGKSAHSDLSRKSLLNGWMFKAEPFVSMFVHQHTGGDNI